MNLNVGDPGPGQYIKVELVFDQVIVRYHNPCVNALRMRRFKTAGGESLVLTGLGFIIPDVDVQNTLNPVNGMPSGGWDSWVTHIYVINAATGATAATLDLAWGEFTLDSNSQITIPAMPALTKGTYWLKLNKQGAQLNSILDAGTNPAGYAGDWRTDAAGEMTAGDCFVLMVGDEPGDIITLTEWTFKKGDLSVQKYYSPIDVISPSRFYDGRILNISPLNRGVSGETGLFSGSDVNITLSNADKEFSQLLAQYYLKNQGVKIYYAWQNAPEAWRTAAAILVADTFSIKGPVFECQLRDPSGKYFRRKVPLYRCTDDEFPNIHPQHLNRPKPEILGRHAYTEANNGGAIEAVYIDTVNFKYLAARGSLHDVTEVYVDGVAADGAIWGWAYDDDGQTIITFTENQGDKRVTFDCEGYMYDDWNSADGYVRNPAYIMLFFIAFLMEVPDTFFDVSSFEGLAGVFDSSGIGTAGKLALMKEEDAENVLKALLYTFGTYSAFDKQGRFIVERKDITDLSAVRTIWAQIDTLDHPVRDFRTDGAYNRVRARWDHAPAPDVWQGGETFTRDSSVDDLEEEIESPFSPDFPCTDDAEWVALRCNEDLLRYSYGDASFFFRVPLEVYDQIDLLDNLRLQDPFGLDAVGGGERGRYVFIERLELNLQNRSVTVYCADLSYIQQQYVLLGDEDDLADEWDDASQEQKIYGYLADETTGRFDDGDPCKVLMDESAF